MRNLQGKCQTRIPGPSFCASLRSRHAHGHVTRGIFRRNLQGKCQTRIPGPAFCASLHSRHAHGHVTRGILCRNLKKKGTRIHGPPICASLRSRHAHGHVTQEVLRAEIYTENAKRFRYHLDWTPALNCYRKNPSVWPHRLGKNTISSPSFMSWQPASAGCRPSQKKTWLLSQGRRLLRSAWWKPTILVIGRYYSMSLLKLMVPIKLPLFPSHLQITIPSEPKVYNFAIITFMNRWSFEHIS